MPSSAVIAEPARAATIIPVKTGASSHIIAIATKPLVISPAPKLSSPLNDCRLKTMPVKSPVKIIIGIDL